MTWPVKENVDMGLNEQRIFFRLLKPPSLVKELRTGSSYSGCTSFSCIWPRFSWFPVDCRQSARKGSAEGKREKRRRKKVGGRSWAEELATGRGIDFGTSTCSAAGGPFCVCDSAAGCHRLKSDDDDTIESLFFLPLFWALFSLCVRVCALPGASFRIEKTKTPSISL